MPEMFGIQKPMKFTMARINSLPILLMNWEWERGLATRVDVQGFVIRFDFAAPFHDPSKQEGFNFDVNETVFNFGIGYPF